MNCNTTGTLYTKIQLMGEAKLVFLSFETKHFRPKIAMCLCLLFAHRQPSLIFKVLMAKKFRIGWAQFQFYFKVEGGGALPYSPSYRPEQR